MKLGKLGEGKIWQDFRRRVRKWPEWTKLFKIQCEKKFFAALGYSSLEVS